MMHNVGVQRQGMRIRSALNEQTEWAPVMLRTHVTNGLPDIARVQFPSEKHRDGDGLTNLSADLPVMEPSCTSKLLHRQGRIPGIEEQGVDRGRHVTGLRHRVLCH